MNQQQAALIVRLNMTDADIAVLYPGADPKWYGLIREWGANGGEIQQSTTLGWLAYPENSFIKKGDYRLAPRTVTLSGPGGTFELPEPMRVAPEYGAEYWLVALHHPGGTVDNSIWQNDHYDFSWLKQGRCHATQEAAQQWADALSKVMGVQS